MKKIVIADDNRASRDLLRAVLKAPDRLLLEASQGQEALDVISREVPNLVLLDLEMPLLDGYAVLRRLRADTRFAGLRVVAVTANAMRGARESVLAAGFDDYVAKPIQAVALRKQVAELLGG